MRKRKRDQVTLMGQFYLMNVGVFLWTNAGLMENFREFEILKFFKY